jgi:hypothetical protein
MLKFELRFWIIPLLGVRASDASDFLMVKYLLELLCDGSPFGASFGVTLPDGVVVGTYPDLGIIIK